MMSEQKLCSECGTYVLETGTSSMIRRVGGLGYVEIITCFSCQKKTQKESAAAVEKLKDKVVSGKLDTTKRLLEKYASDPEYSLNYFAREIHRLYTGKESK